MRFKLKVVQGALKRQDGSSLGTEIPVAGKCFVIGTARNCHLRCASESISPFHCLILIERDRVVVRDEVSQGGTFVNGARIHPTACLFHGDRLRVGKLEFDVVMSTAAPRVPAPPPSAPVEMPSQRDTVVAPTDTVADLVVDMLLNADEAERDRRRFDPASREFRPTTDVPTPAEKTAANLTAKSKIPVKRPPTKLPAPAPVRAADTINAAEQALSQMITQATRKKSDG